MFIWSFPGRPQGQIYVNRRMLIFTIIFAMTCTVTCPILIIGARSYCYYIYIRLHNPCNFLVEITGSNLKYQFVFSGRFISLFFSCLAHIVGVLCLHSSWLNDCSTAFYVCDMHQFWYGVQYWILLSYYFSSRTVDFVGTFPFYIYTSGFHNSFCLLAEAKRV